MEIIYTDDNFTHAGQSYPDIPILIDKECEIVTPVFQFMTYLVIQDARVQSLSTIKSYATSLYDYFSFLEVNELIWNEPYLQHVKKFNLSVLALYRNWSRTLFTKQGVRSVADTTINLRLSVLKRFYTYAYHAGLIDFEPWETLYKIQPNTHNQFLRHTHGQAVIKSNDLVLKTFKAPPKILSIKQCKQLIAALNSPTFKLMTKLILASGIRKDEAMSFTINHVFEPFLQDINKRIAIDLVPQPQGQRTKGSRPRRIFISVQLMQELWDYINIGERVLRGKRYNVKHKHQSPFVFINRFGEAFTDATLNNVYRKLCKGRNKKLDFNVSPHMLRHTFATIELYAEAQRVGTVKALWWVQQRMGHASLLTTSVYLHCIENSLDNELTKYQRELDSMA